MIYWLVFFYCTTIAFLGLDRKLKPFSDLFFVYTFVFMFFFIGFRYDSIDYYGYFSIWEAVEFKNFGFPFYTIASGGTSGKEFFFASFISLFKFFNLPFIGFIAFISFTSIFLKFYYFKKISPYPLLSVVLYLSMGLTLDLGQLRTGLAGAILLLTIKPIIDRNLSRFLLIVLLSFGVQAFAIVVLPIFWLYAFIIKNKIIPLVVVFSSFILSALGGFPELVVSSLTVAPIEIAEKVEGYYLGNGGQVMAFTKRGSVFFLIAIIFLLYKDEVYKKSKSIFVLGVFHTYGVILFLSFTGIDIISNRSLNLLSYTSLPIILLAPFYFFGGFFRLFYGVFLMIFSGLLFYFNDGALNDYKNVLFAIT